MTVRQRRPYAARVPMPERREQLLDAALAIIVRDGYDQVSIEAIAREAGVTRPVVYGAFDRLNDLLAALLDREEARTFGVLVETLPDITAIRDLPTYLTESVARLIAMFSANPDPWRPILLTQAGAPAAVIERIDTDRARLCDMIAGFVSFAASQQKVVVDAPLVAHGLVALLEHFGRLMLTDPDTFSGERVTAGVTQAIRLILR